MAMCDFRNQLDLRCYFYGNVYDASADDRSPYLQSGTLVGTASVASGYLVLDGDSDYLTYPDAASNSLFSGDGIRGFTAFAWFNVDSVDTVDQVLIAKWDEGDNNKSFRLFIDATTDVIQSIIPSDGSTDDSDISTTATISAATDYFVAMTWDGMQHKVFINGAEKASGFYSGGIYDGDEVVSVGADFNTTSQAFADGTFYQAGLFGRALSTQQMLSLYLRGKDRQIIELDKELLWSERFEAGKIPAGWQIESGDYNVGYDSTLSQHYLECTVPGVIGITVPAIMQDLSASGFDFEWELYKGLEGNFISVSIICDIVAEETYITGYRFHILDAGNVRLIRENGGTDDVLFASSDALNPYFTYDTWHSCRITRSTAGVLSTYVDDTLVPAATGNNPETSLHVLTSSCIVLEFDSSDKITDFRVSRF